MQGKYDSVFIDKIRYKLPPKAIESSRLSKIAIRVLKSAGFVVPEGFIYTYTGIESRRVWPKGTNLIKECQNLAEQCLEHKTREDFLSWRYCSLTKPFLEPATIAAVMSGISQSREAEGFDISNACLGIADGLVSVANDIELGRTNCGLVIGFEDSRRLILNTLQYLQAHYVEKRDKRDFREMVASLTLGSSAVAISLNREQGICSLVGFYGQNDVTNSHLCVGGFEGNRLLVRTNAPALQEEGIPLVRDTIRKGLEYVGWDKVNVVITHQVGKKHQEAVVQELSGIADNCNFTTYSELGNMGSNSMPITLAMAIEQGIIQQGYRVALLPFASGLFAKPIFVQF